MTDVDPSRFATAAAELAQVCRWLHRQGWSPATSGNSSVRLADQVVAITASGQDKEVLAADQILTVDLAGRPLGPGKPSAETLLHTRLYRRLPGIGAVLHTHSTGATVLSRLVGAGGRLTLDGYELAKAFAGITDHLTPLVVPVLANRQDMVALADAVDAVLDQQPQARAYLIEGHGTYTWGATLEQARFQMEALEFLFTCEVQLRRLR